MLLQTDPFGIHFCLCLVMSDLAVGFAKIDEICCFGHFLKLLKLERLSGKIS